MEPKTADNAVPREIGALFSHQRVVLREISGAATPLGGVGVFVAFLEKLNFAGKVREHMPFRFPSPNQIEPTVTLTAFLIAVLAGAKRFAHTGLFRGDRALHALLSMPRFPPTTLSAIGTMVPAPNNPPCPCRFWLLRRQTAQLFGRARPARHCSSAHDPVHPAPSATRGPLAGAGRKLLRLCCTPELPRAAHIFPFASALKASLIFADNQVDNH